jgi:hypothetical protein
MGNSASERSFVPRSLGECIAADGTFDEELYYLYKRQKHRKQSQEELNAIINQSLLFAEEEMNESNVSPS